MNQLWRFFDSNIMPPVLASQLRINSALEGCVRGAKERRLRDYRCNRELTNQEFTDFLINQRLKLNNIKLNYQTSNGKYTLYKRRSSLVDYGFELARNSNIIDQIEEDVNKVYPKELDLMRIHMRILSPLTLSFFAFINVIQYFTAMSIFEDYRPIIDCIMPGRLIFSGSMTYKGKLYGSLLIFIYLNLKISQNSPIKILSLDFVEFVVTPEEEVIKKLFYCDDQNKFHDSSSLYECFVNLYNSPTKKTSDYNSTFHLRLSRNKIIPKLNRDLSCRRIMLISLRIMITLSLLILCLSSFVTVTYTLMFSLTHEGEYLAYPYCYFWTHNKHVDYSNPDILGYRVVFNPKILNDSMIIYHAMGNTIFNGWFIFEIIVYAYSFATLVVVVPLDLVLYCRRLEKEMQRLIQQLNGPQKLSSSNDTKFLSFAICHQSLAYFNQIKQYNILIRKMSLCLSTLNLVVNSLTLISTLINGKMLEDVEMYIVSAALLFSDIVLFSLLELVRKNSLNIYPLMLSISAYSVDQEMKLAYSNLSTMYSRPAYCFSFGGIELSLFYFLKSSSFITTIVAFMYNIFITRNFVKNINQPLILQNQTHWKS